MHFFQALFLDFQLQQLAISKPLGVEKSYIPQKKALLPIVWKKFWNWVNLGHERLQTNSSKRGAFLLRRAWPALGQYHAPFSNDSKSSVLGLSNEVSFVSTFFWKKGKNWGKAKSMIWPNVSNWRRLYLLSLWFIFIYMKN